MEPSNIGKENIKDFNDKLIAAVKVSDIKTVEGLLDSGADIGHMDFTGSSPVYYACAKGNVEMLRVLMSRGADVNADCYTGKRKLLHIASQYSHHKVVKYLLEANAKVTAVNGSNATVLHEVYSKKVAKLLLEHGSDMEIMDRSCMNALHQACNRDLLPIVRVLMRYGARIDQTCSRMYTPLYYAVSHKNIDIVRFLLENKANVNFKNKFGATPLHLACERLAVGVVKILLTYGADVTLTDRRGRTALHYICHYLLDSHDDIRSGSGEPIELYNSSGDLRSDIIKLLLHKGADMNSKCRKGMTPLHCAAKEVCAAAVKGLLENGADVNTVCQKGKTPLNYAYYFGGMYDERDYVSCCVILERQIIKLKCVNYYVCKENIRLVNSSEKARDFLKHCEIEVFKLKSHTVYKKICFYDFLTKNEDQLAKYTKNVSVMRAIEELEIREMYPIYGDMIEENIKKGQRRLSLLKEGEKCLIKMLNYKLPLVFMSDVLTYLKNEDLCNLVVSCQQDN